MTKHLDQPEVFDLADALAIEGGKPQPAKLGELEFKIRRQFTGAEVLEISLLSVSGSAADVVERLTEGIDPAALAALIEGQAATVAQRLWSTIFAQAGLTYRGE